jgi:Tfp pilus assembly protein PilO
MVEFDNLKDFHFSVPGEDPSSDASKKKAQISTGELLYYLKERKFELIAAAILIITVLGCFQLFTSRMSLAEANKSRVRMLKEKVAPMEEYNKSLSESRALLGSVPPIIAQDAFMSEITNKASRRGIRIASFSPANVVEEGFYRKISAQILCRGASLKDVLFFMNDLEGAAYSVRIESWSVRPLVDPGASGVTVEMTLSSVRVYDADAKNQKDR